MASTDERDRSDRPAPARRDYPALTGLRFVAALWVAAYHYSGSLGPLLHAHLQVLWPVIRAGWLGVDLFFVLSGFVITNAYLASMGPRFDLRSVGTFLWARFARVWPVWFLVTVLFGTALLISDPGQTGTNSTSVSVWHTVDQLLMIHLWHSPGILETSYVVPGWSLSAEWLAYVCFPLVALAAFRLRRLHPGWLAAAAVGVMLPLALVGYFQGDSQDRWELRIAGGFLGGVLMAMAVLRLRITPLVERIAALATVAALAELVVVCWWSDLLGGALMSVSVPVFPVLVGSLAIGRGRVARWLTTPVMQMGGRSSYSLYLTHGCILVGFHTIASSIPRIAPGSKVYELALTQVFLLSLPVAYGVWRWIEEPSRRWLMARRPAVLSPGAARSARPGLPRHSAGNRLVPAVGSTAPRTSGGSVESTLRIPAQSGHAGR